ncbi:uncharacterized protein C18orf63 isoform X2 [Nematostella vectensis]|uniref:uncharacterized protein C18orf63 isoform X2 n=1 Tax=Nematostella vectensis TaxID=45351 RepID=UPI002077125F|nr:uncharacterized protein C18orf63 isoform X2 [Nematostella vectensis]
MSSFTGLFFGSLPKLGELMAVLMEEVKESDVAAIQPGCCRELIFTESRVILSPCVENPKQVFLICKREVWECSKLQANLNKLNLEVNQYCVNSKLLQSFSCCFDASIGDCAIQDDLCYVLPSLKKGRVLSITHQLPADSPFASYEDIRKYWKLVYGYRLPAHEKVFYNVRFFFRKSKVFTYPASCIHSAAPHVYPRCDQHAIFTAFINNLQSRVPSVCGTPFRLTSAPLYYTNRLHSASQPQSNLTRTEPVLKQCRPFMSTIQCNSKNGATRIDNSLTHNSTIASKPEHAVQSHYQHSLPQGHSRSGTSRSGSDAAAYAPYMKAGTVQAQSPVDNVTRVSSEKLSSTNLTDTGSNHDCALVEPKPRIVPHFTNNKVHKKKNSFQENQKAALSCHDRPKVVPKFNQKLAQKLPQQSCNIHRRQSERNPAEKDKCPPSDTNSVARNTSFSHDYDNYAIQDKLLTHEQPHPEQIRQKVTIYPLRHGKMRSPLTSGKTMLPQAMNQANRPVSQMEGQEGMPGRPVLPPAMNQANRPVSQMEGQEGIPGRPVLPPAINQAKRPFSQMEGQEGMPGRPVLPPTINQAKRPFSQIGGFTQNMFLPVVQTATSHLGQQRSDPFRDASDILSLSSSYGNAGSSAKPLKRSQSNEADNQPKKARPKSKVQENVDVRQMALTNQLHKVNSVTLIDWLRKHHIAVKSKDKKAELVERVMRYMALHQHEV